jgi:hypothetical protein
MVLEVNEGWETSLEVKNETLGENMLMMLITTIHQSTILRTTFSWLILITNNGRRGVRGNNQVGEVEELLLKLMKLK